MKSTIISGAGFTAEFFTAFMKEAKKLGVTDEQIYEATKTDSDFIERFAGKCAEMVVGTAKNMLRIFANLSLSDRIARGKYDLVNSDITEEKFPTSVSVDYEVEYKLFHFNREISSEDVIREMWRDGFRPGNLAELCAFGEAHSEEQRKHPIVALGSACRGLDGLRNVPVLQSVMERKLLLDLFGVDWATRCRFLAVRN